MNDFFARLKRIPFWVWFALLALLAFRVRVFLFPFEGVDDSWWLAWADAAQKGGVSAPYLWTGWHLPANYPPLFMYVLMVFGWIQAKTNCVVDVITLVHLFSCTFDVITAWLITRLVIPTHGKSWGIIAAASWLFSPYIIYESGLWAQNDILVSFWAILTLWLLQTKRTTWATIAVILGLLTKPQFVVVVPFFIVWVLVRKEWSFRQWITGILASILTLSVVLLPLAKNKALGIMFHEAYQASAGYYPYYSLNAYNVWWLQVPDPRDWLHSFDYTKVLGSLSAFQVGLIAFGAVYALLIALLVKRAKKTSLLDLAWIASLGVFAFFLLSTQMHERYNYQFFALALLGCIGLRGKVAWFKGVSWWILTLAGVVNLAMVESASPWMKANIFTISHTIAWINIAVFIALLVHLIWSPPRAYES